MTTSSPHHVIDVPTSTSQAFPFSLCFFFFFFFCTVLPLLCIIEQKPKNRKGGKAWDQGYIVHPMLSSCTPKIRQGLGSTKLFLLHVKESILYLLFLQKLVFRPLLKPNWKIKQSHPMLILLQILKALPPVQQDAAVVPARLQVRHLKNHRLVVDVAAVHSPAL